VELQIRGAEKTHRRRKLKKTKARQTRKNSKRVRDITGGRQKPGGTSPGEEISKLDKPRGKTASTKTKKNSKEPAAVFVEGLQKRGKKEPGELRGTESYRGRKLKIGPLNIKKNLKRRRRCTNIRARANAAEKEKKSQTGVSKKTFYEGGSLGGFRGALRGQNIKKHGV